MRHSQTGGFPHMAIDPKLLEILACPDCKSEVFESENKIYCTKSDCRRRYDITDDIPVMLIEESTALDPEQWQSAMNQRPK
jgi:uncharacterized protein YbaR (Trm112 family)